MQLHLRNSFFMPLHYRTHKLPRWDFVPSFSCFKLPRQRQWLSNLCRQSLIGLRLIYHLSQAPNLLETTLLFFLPCGEQTKSPNTWPVIREILQPFISVFRLLSRSTALPTRFGVNNSRPLKKLSSFLRSLISVIITLTRMLS